MVIQGYVLDYMATINTGVTASRIPYSRGSGARSSQYIQGLTNYVKRRMGKSDKEAKSIAFAIASKHKKEGMPTKSEMLQITPEILHLVARIEEFKGIWRALGTLASDRLAALRRVATIESIS